MTYGLAFISGTAGDAPVILWSFSVFYEKWFMKHRFYPVIKFGSRLTLAVIMLAVIGILAVTFISHHLVDIQKLLSFVYQCDCRVLLLLCGAAACFTFALGAAECERSNNRKLAASKEQPDLLTDGDDAIEGV